MPRPVNRLQITGNLCKDPEITVINKGDAPLKIATFQIAFDWWNGKKLNPTWFFNCASYGKCANAVEKFLSKGKKIIITDSFLKLDKYQAKDGTIKKDFKIVVIDFMILGYNKETTGREIDSIAEEINDVDEVPY